MCGIVGLFIKKPEVEADLGSLLVPMLEALAERGPDSTGIALYHHPDDESWRISLRRRDPSLAWDDVAAAIGAEGEVGAHGDCALLATSLGPDRVRTLLVQTALPVDMISAGRSAEVVKDVGHATDVCRRMAIGDRAGYQAIGHTRMATESAVTVLHSHPFSPSPDLNLVHNGSFSNHASVRRRLQAAGIRFDSDNDSEVAARLVAHHLDQGDGLEAAIGWVQRELDGFFTLLVATQTEFAVVRDAFACKPAAVAETNSFVAVASEYRALAGLPDIETARVFEPAPATVYTWIRERTAATAGALV
jgi:methylamine---glutamate N-methyltransferase subunit A